MSNFSLTHVKKMIAKMPKTRQAAMVCAMVGHSRIVDVCFGQVTCARCDAILGDALIGAYDLSQRVIRGHYHGECEECRKAYRNMTWVSRFMVKDPFRKAAV